MPPDLRKAHNQLDNAVDKCYRKKAFSGERERMGWLSLGCCRRDVPWNVLGKRKEKEKVAKDLHPSLVYAVPSGLVGRHPDSNLAADKCYRKKAFSGERERMGWLFFGCCRRDVPPKASLLLGALRSYLFCYHQ